MITKKMRWTLYGEGETARIHIQVKGEGGNREYGDAFDLPLHWFVGYPNNMNEQAVRAKMVGDTVSLATDKPYTKGLLCSVPHVSLDNTNMLRIYLSRGGTDYLLNTKDDAKVEEHLAFVEANGKDK
jgi:hypothetical protein